jgi:O-acetyl-ADP-ribose deacetylase (regulator of RNase III)
VKSSLQDFSLRLVLKGEKLFDLHGPADITKETTDAIVNAANSSLLGGGGVDGAIHSVGGPSILEECKRIVKEIRRLPAGKAVITTGGRLPAKYVIHTVGPVYSSGRRDEAEMLASCYRESIRMADEHDIRSVAFPAISTGTFGYPAVEASAVAVPAALAALEAAQQVKQIRFVMFDVGMLRIYTRAAEKLHQSGKISVERIERAAA